MFNDYHKNYVEIPNAELVCVQKCTEVYKPAGTGQEWEKKCMNGTEWNHGNIPMQNSSML